MIAAGDDLALQFLNEAVSPSEYVFVYPYCPMDYFLADVRNQTRFSILLHNLNTGAQFDEVIAVLFQVRDGHGPQAHPAA